MCKYHSKVFGRVSRFKAFKHWLICIYYPALNHSLFQSFGVINSENMDIET